MFEMSHFSTRLSFKQYWKERNQRESSTKIKRFKKDQKRLLEDRKHQGDCHPSGASSLSRWSQEDFNTIPFEFPESYRDLAGSYIATLLHWFAAELESEFDTKQRPYHYFIRQSPVNLETLSRYKIEDENEASDNLQVYTIGILSDWASGTRESYVLAKQVFNQQNLFNVHLGDTYFTGRFQDCLENFCGQENYKGVRGVQFPWGTRGALAVPGNHEAYSHNIGFRNIIMPFCGSLDEKHADEDEFKKQEIRKEIQHIPQQSPFWSLEFDQWIVLGLDSAYDCVNIQEWNPETNMEAGRSRMRFPDLLVQWIEANFQDSKSKQKGIVILTHHPPQSLFDDELAFEGLADQLADLLTDKTVVWLWGHEHQLIHFKCQTWTNSKHHSFQFYARCIGNGGFPCENQGANTEKLLRAVNQHVDVVLAVEFGPGYDFDATKRAVQDYPYGRNGSVQMQITKNQLTLKYFVLTGDEKHSESRDSSDSSCELYVTETFEFHDHRVHLTSFQISDFQKDTSWYAGEFKCDPVPALQRSKGKSVDCSPCHCTVM